MNLSSGRVSVGSTVTLEMGPRMEKWIIGEVFVGGGQEIVGSTF